MQQVGWAAMQSLAAEQTMLGCMASGYRQAVTTLGTGWGCMEKRTAGLELWDGRFGGWSAPLERLAVAHQLLAQRNFQCGEDGIRPAPSDGAVATVARASAGRCWPHRSLLWSIVPGTELYFTGLKGRASALSYRPEPQPFTHSCRPLRRPLLTEPRNKGALFGAAVAVAGHSTVGHVRPDG